MPDRIEEATKFAVDWTVDFLKSLPSKIISAFKDIFLGIFNFALGPIKKIWEKLTKLLNVGNVGGKLGDI